MLWLTVWSTAADSGGGPWQTVSPIAGVGVDSDTVASYSTTVLRAVLTYCLPKPTRTISLDQTAYERLRAEKREGESFSDVVKRLAGGRSWTEVAGIWTDASDVEDAIDEGRDRSRRRRERADESDPE